ncbi:hypothetical protein VOLCADRAFT_100136 [Volvox carteri f. nagariensis]|uniref:Uncharacterized protein n=1 Tax=Volvox carteri f. nagariensis TaxID=3068 RepID=D8UJI1_VOLCA|nr:uncharacterized protein VOLCADRAFT_100136 [Volvox carteri f. nagariensis]EFJ40126.1 hypothetical protein VOLCADRAFT_100136 [Volvox carteri f. nagariensis]|eukprot:XP_002958822.1 hypothetical protein VOLCADRAFT_100136 [Volvox carteri f. nagariensis]
MLAQCWPTGVEDADDAATTTSVSLASSPLQQQQRQRQRLAQQRPFISVMNPSSASSSDIQKLYEQAANISAIAYLLFASAEPLSYAQVVLQLYASLPERCTSPVVKELYGISWYLYGSSPGLQACQYDLFQSLKAIFSWVRQNTPLRLQYIPDQPLATAAWPDLILRPPLELSKALSEALSTPGGELGSVAAVVAARCGITPGDLAALVPRISAALDGLHVDLELLQQVSRGLAASGMTSSADAGDGGAASSRRKEAAEAAAEGLMPRHPHRRQQPTARPAKDNAHVSNDFSSSSPAAGAGAAADDDDDDDGDDGDDDDDGDDVSGIRSSRRRTQSTSKSSSDSDPVYLLPPGINMTPAAAMPALLIPLVFHVMLYKDSGGGAIGPADYLKAPVYLDRMVRQLNLMSKPTNMQFFIKEVRNNAVSHPRLLLADRATWLSLPFCQGSTCLTDDNFVSALLSDWPRSINVFVVSDGTAGGNILGYAYIGGSYPISPSPQPPALSRPVLLLDTLNTISLSLLFHRFLFFLSLSYDVTYSYKKLLLLLLLLLLLFRLLLLGHNGYFGLRLLLLIAASHPPGTTRPRSTTPEHRRYSTKYSTIWGYNTLSAATQRWPLAAATMTMSLTRLPPWTADAGTKTKPGGIVLVLKESGPVSSSSYYSTALSYCMELFWGRDGGNWDVAFQRLSSGPLGIPEADMNAWADSCPTRAGYDELGNYMTYNTAVCYAALGHLTAAQAQRAHYVTAEMNPVLYAWGQYYAKTGVPPSQAPGLQVLAASPPEPYMDVCKVTGTGCACKSKWSYGSSSYSYCVQLDDKSSRLWCQVEDPATCSSCTNYQTACVMTCGAAATPTVCKTPPLPGAISPPPPPPRIQMRPLPPPPPPRAVPSACKPTSHHKRPRGAIPQTHVIHPPPFCSRKACRCQTVPTCPSYFTDPYQWCSPALSASYCQSEPIYFSTIRIPPHDDPTSSPVNSPTGSGAKNSWCRHPTTTSASTATSTTICKATGIPGTTTATTTTTTIVSVSKQQPQPSQRLPTDSADGEMEIISTSSSAEPHIGQPLAIGDWSQGFEEENNGCLVTTLRKKLMSSSAFPFLSVHLAKKPPSSSSHIPAPFYNHSSVCYIPLLPPSPACF